MHMAEHALSQNTPARSYGRELDQNLQEVYNMPTSQWWESVQLTFLRLEKLLHPKSVALLSNQLDEPAEEYAISARVARAASMPSIILLPAGTHALSLTATNETLQCMAFGTVGPKLYVELVRESIVQAQEAGTIKIAVYEILQGPVPRITLRVEAHVFELKYLQCESLVRAYPNVVDAAGSFLADRNNCNTTTQEAVKKLQQERQFQDKLKEHPHYRRAYYYKRAWAIAWGSFNCGKNAQVIFEMCDSASNEGNGDFSSIVSKFVEQWSLHYPQTLRYRSNDWNWLLTKIEDMSFCQKLDYPSYLQITVVYTGSSSTKGGEWLSMVERKLQWLKDSLEVSVPIGQLAPGAIQPFRIWPQRLVRRHSDSEDRIYEGCFVLGLDVEQSTLSTAADVAERWKLRVQEDDLTVVGQCFVDVIISQGKSNIEKQDLKPCTRTWPRSIVKADERSKGSQTQKLSKREKREMMKGRKDNETMEVAAEATKTARKLRPASDVLNRLRHGRDYDIDEFVVGYKDRHSSMPMEKPAVHWAKDTTDEEFIPEHRIEYFKRYRPGGKEEVLWDKCSRLDKIFQNSGSGNVELDCPTVGPFQ